MNRLKHVPHAISQEFKDSLSVEKNNILMPRSSMLSSASLDKILEDIRTQVGYDSIDQVKTLLTVFFQQGGSTRGCDGNMTVKVFTKEVKLATIRRILKDNGCARNERKLARSIASDIYDIGLVLELPGNVSNKIQKLRPNENFSMSDKVWLSDFQLYNDNLPPRLRTYITESFPERKTQRK